MNLLLRRPDTHAPLLSLTHALLAIALFGLVTTTVPALSQLLGVPVICGPFAQCNEILQHPSARLAGIPVALLGVGAFGLALILVTRLSRSTPAAQALLAVALVALLASLALQWGVHRQLGLVCPWCLGAAAAMGALAVLTGIALVRPRARQPVRPVVLVAGGVIAALFVASEFALMLRAAGS